MELDIQREPTHSVDAATGGCLPARACTRAFFLFSGAREVAQRRNGNEIALEGKNYKDEKAALLNYSSVRALRTIRSRDKSGASRPDLNFARFFSKIDPRARINNVSIWK